MFLKHILTYIETILPRILCWGNHFDASMFSNLPGNRSGSYFQTTLYGSAESTSRKNLNVLFGKYCQLTLVPRLT